MTALHARITVRAFSHASTGGMVTTGALGVELRQAVLQELSTSRKTKISLPSSVRTLERMCVRISPERLVPCGMIM